LGAEDRFISKLKGILPEIFLPIQSACLHSWNIARAAGVTTTDQETSVFALITAVFGRFT
jgi:hypothetical protein